VGLLDIRLGNMSGIDLLERLNIRYPTIICVMITAYAATDTAVQALRHRAYDYLYKPVHPEDLLATLERCFDKRRLEDERYQAQEALFQEKERAKLILHSIGDCVITTDVKGRIEYMNPAAERLIGWVFEQAQGRALETVVHIVDGQRREQLPGIITRCQYEGHTAGQGDQYTLIRRDGQEFSVQDSAGPILDRMGQVSGVVLTLSDNTEMRRMVQQMSYQASHDALTDLVNRREFEQRLQRVLGAVRTEYTEHALCYLDLDQFKVVNDSCGHVAGDELLRQVANLLQAQVRKRDTLARLGGDEFGILMEHCSLEQATRVAEALRLAIQEFRFLWQGERFILGVSIGLVPITAASETVTTVLRAADTACYAAKDQGRNRIHLSREGDEELVRRYGEMQWMTRIPWALEGNHFQLYFQRIAQLSDVENSRGHYELLLRIKLEDGRIVLPGAFLPAAERYNLATKIDCWVIRTALNWLAHHPAHLENLYLCAINLSGHSLGKDEFLGFVSRQLDETGIPPQKICFEITETAAIANLTQAIQFIEALSSAGCRFALDDFGSGLSSFSYLKNLPVDFLKIDGGFVKGMVDDPVDLAMVASINEIGKVMGKKTIAEFAENEAILARLQDIGVDYAQGYAINRPQPIEEMQ
jgi:diguanylate cyclase (GGDEF)-like protein/PAS domain S-box-containing protein